MDTFVFFLIVGLILMIGVLVSVQLNAPGSLGTGRIRRIRRLRTVRTASGMVNTLPVETVIEEIIDEVEPEPEEEEV